MLSLSACSFGIARRFINKLQDHYIGAHCVARRHTHIPIPLLQFFSGHINIYWKHTSDNNAREKIGHVHYYYMTFRILFIVVKSQFAIQINDRAYNKGPSWHSRPNCFSFVYSNHLIKFKATGDLRSLNLNGHFLIKWLLFICKYRFTFQTLSN